MSYGTELPDAQGDRFLHSSLALVLSNGTGAVLGVGFWAVAAHLYPVRLVGYGAAEIAAMTFVGSIALLNLGTVFPRFLYPAGSKAGTVLRTGYAASVTMALVAGAVFLTLTGHHSFLPAGLPASFEFLGAVVLWVIFTIEDAALIGMRATIWVPVENTSFSVGKILLLPVFAAVAARSGVFVSWNLPVIACVVAVNVYLFRKVLPAHVARSAGRGVLPERRVLRTVVLGEYLGGLSFMAMTSLPAIIVVSELGAKSVAYFQTPWLAGTSFDLLLFSFASSLISEASARPGSASATVRRAVRLAPLILLPGLVLLVVGAPYFLRVLGPAYAANGTNLLRLVALALPFMAVNVLYVTYARLARRVRRVLMIQVSTATIVLTLTALFLHHFGITGVGLAFLIGHGVVSFVVFPSVLMQYRRPGMVPNYAPSATLVARSSTGLAGEESDASGSMGGVMTLEGESSSTDREVRSRSSARQRRKRVGPAAMPIIAVLVAALIAVALIVLVPADPGPRVASTASSLPPGIRALTGLVCETSRDCVAVGSGGIEPVSGDAAALRTTNGGRSWERSSVPRGTAALTALSCSGGTCIAGAGAKAGTPSLARSTNGGASWHVATLPSLRSPVLSTSCATRSRCVLVSARGASISTDAGRTWSVARATGSLSLDSVACPSAAICLGVGLSRSTGAGAVAATRDGGRTWHVVHRLQHAVVPTGIHCLSKRVCGVSVDDHVKGGARAALLQTLDGGATWSTRYLPPSLKGASGFSCTTTLRCSAWGASASNATTSLVTWTSDGGARWTAPVDAPHGVAISAMACASRGSCEIVGADAQGVLILGTTSGGSTWSPQPLPAGVLRIEGISCVSLSACVLAVHASHGGAIYTTTNRGRSWHSATLPGATFAVTSVTCLSATFCAASANGLLLSTDGGDVWHRDTVTLGAQSIKGVACTSSTECVLVGGRDSSGDASAAQTGDSVVYEWRSGEVTRVPIPGSASSLASVACVSGTCVAVGGNGTGATSDTPLAIASHDGGARWARSTVPADTLRLSSVACRSATSCLAGGQVTGSAGSEPGVFATFNGGRTWSDVTTIQGIGQINGVSCTGLSCAAVGVASVSVAGGGQLDYGFTLSLRLQAGDWIARLFPETPTFDLIGTARQTALVGVSETSHGTHPHVVRLP